MIDRDKIREVLEVLEKHPVRRGDLVTLYSGLDSETAFTLHEQLRNIAGLSEYPKGLARFAILSFVAGAVLALSYQKEKEKRA